MALKINDKPKSDKPSGNAELPILSPKDVEKMTGGALTYGQLKQDRMEAEANGTPPKIPYYRFGYRTVRYKPSDIRAFIETHRVG